MDTTTFDKLHGFYFEDLSIGMSAEFSRVIEDSDVIAYVGLSGDANPLHLDEEFARSTRAGGCVAHGMLTAGLLSTIVGCKLPGPGCLWMSQSLRFLRPVKVGDRVEARGTIAELIPDKQRVGMDMRCLVEETVVLQGEALVWVPRRESR